MITALLILIGFAFILAGMSYPIVRGVSEEKEERFNKNQQKKVNAKTVTERRRRFYKQCALMANLEKINRARKVVPRQYMAVDSQRPYDVISKLTLPVDDKGELIGQDLLFTLTSDEISSLVPKVKLYKVVYEEGSEGDSSRSANVLIPFDDYTDPANILNITRNSKGRSGGVGLKSFQWTSLGTNPANVNIFETEITIYFQNIEQIFEERGYDPFRQQPIRFADMLIQQAKFVGDPGSEEYNEDYFRLKAVVGWAAPDNNFWKSSSRRRNIKRLLERSTTNLLLTLKGHDIDFREDGSVEIKINYLSSIEGIMNSPKSNILRADDAYTQARKEYEKKLKEAKEDFSQQYPNESVNSSNIEDSSEEDKDKKQELREKIKTLEEDVKNQKIIEKNTKYSIFMSKLIAGGLISTLKVPKEIINFLSEYTLDSGAIDGGFVDIKAYEARRKQTADLNRRTEVVGGVGNSPAAEKLQKSLLALIGQFKELDISNTKSIEEVKKQSDIMISGEQNYDLSLINRFFNSFFDSPNEKNIENIKEAYEEFQEAQQQLANEQATNMASTACEEEVYLVRFFRLGDLIDIALKDIFLPNNKETGAGLTFFDKKIKVLLGSFTYNDYGEEADGGRSNSRIIRTQDGKIVKLLSGKQKTMNLADVPISLDVFQRWFNQNVVARGREQYLFSNFIRDVVVDLVPMSLGQNCYDYAPKQKIRFSMVPITVNAVNPQTGDFFNRETGLRIKSSDLPARKNTLDNSKTDEILYIYAQTQNPYSLMGNYDEDRSNGIPHFYWGADTGLVKSINFNREDQPYLREANISRGMDNTSTGVGKILREKYNANIDLFGNNLFYPGQKVYVNPSVQTLGRTKDPKSRIRELGFGGYYDVIRVTSIIEPGNFETKLETKWQTFGDGKYLDGEPVKGPAKFVKHTP